LDTVTLPAWLFFEMNHRSNVDYVLVVFLSAERVAVEAGVPQAVYPEGGGSRRTASCARSVSVFSTTW
jgi:hypothetical protein